MNMAEKAIEREKEAEERDNMSPAREELLMGQLQMQSDMTDILKTEVDGAVLWGCWVYFCKCLRVQQQQNKSPATSVDQGKAVFL